MCVDRPAQQNKEGTRRQLVRRSLLWLAFCGLIIGTPILQACNPYYPRPCRTNKDCRERELCHAKQRLCYQPCKTNADCNDDQTCRRKRCVWRPNVDWAFGVAVGVGSSIGDDDDTDDDGWVDEPDEPSEPDPPPSEPFDPGPDPWDDDDWDDDDDDDDWSDDSDDSDW